MRGHDAPPCSHPLPCDHRAGPPACEAQPCALAGAAPSTIRALGTLRGRRRSRTPWSRPHRADPRLDTPPARSTAPAPQLRDNSRAFCAAVAATEDGLGVYEMASDETAKPLAGNALDGPHLTCPHDRPQTTQLTVDGLTPSRAATILCGTPAATAARSSRTRRSSSRARGLLDPGWLHSGCAAPLIFGPRTRSTRTRKRGRPQDTAARTPGAPGSTASISLSSDSRAPRCR